MAECIINIFFTVADDFGTRDGDFESVFDLELNLCNQLEASKAGTYRGHYFEGDGYNLELEADDDARAGEIIVQCMQAFSRSTTGHAVKRFPCSGDVPGKAVEFRW